MAHQKNILRGILLLAAPMSAIAVSVACSSPSSDGAAPASVQSGSDAAASGGAVTTDGSTSAGGTGSGGSAGSGGAAGERGTGGASGAGATNGTGGVSADAGIGATCGGVPLPLAHELPEPNNNVDPSATLKEIAISGPASTYATGGTAGTVTNISASLTDQGVYTDGSVRYIENLTADINYHSKVVWTSSDPTIAGVASGDSRTDGGVQGFRAGTVTITATLGSVSKSVCFVVTPPVVAMLTITGPGSTPSSAFSPIVEKQGDAAPLTCTETLTDGTKVDVTTSVTWASSVPAVATVSTTGATHGLTGGTTVITASLPASVATANAEDAKTTATLDVIGSTGLQEGASCGASPQACAAGLSCCADGRLSTTSSCTPTLSLAPGEGSCPQYP